MLLSLRGQLGLLIDRILVAKRIEHAFDRALNHSLLIEWCAVVELAVDQVPDFPEDRELCAELLGRGLVCAAAGPKRRRDIAVERDAPAEHDRAEPAGEKPDAQQNTGDNAAFEDQQCCSHTLPPSQTRGHGDEGIKSLLSPCLRVSLSRLG